MNSEERKKIIAKSPISFKYLKRFNTAAGILHLIQGIIMLVLGLQLEWSRDIYTFYMKLEITTTGSTPIFNAVPDPQILLNIGYLGAILASFPLISALAHFIIAYPKNKSYNENLRKGMNPYRWYEYAFSSSIMITLISLFLGIWDLWSLVMIFVLNAMMIMFGYLMEVINQKTEKTSWSAFILGSISGFTPWVVLYAYFIAAINSVGVEPPTFVYMILFIYFFVFNIFALNMVLQYKGVGKWKDYLYGERFYIILSFVAKTILSWLVFIGIFAPF
ncbi:MAG: heliorhodopsin HeR [Candidatus Bathyarchaeota archaeon]|nr:heliorhodopsin HeR [Candidatus Bathyarchaeum tardum]WGM89963.1 MAG: heliorhodopsin HeR [Candidatus Bathyarchaeum tardum]WNZ29898.1 MAG: heliorhodopsin HeR [Candidatus Bathyarchaeota archaeon]